MCCGLLHAQVQAAGFIRGVAVAGPQGCRPRPDRAVDVEVSRQAADTGAQLAKDAAGVFFG
jgi:hypothetical protein